MKRILIAFLFALGIVGLGTEALAQEFVPMELSAENYDLLLTDNVVSNPIGETNTQDAVRRILSKNFVSILNLILGGLAIFLLAITGIRYIFSSGDAEKQKKALQHLTWIIIGLLFFSLAEALVFQVLDPFDTADPGAGNDIIEGENAVFGFGEQVKKLKRYVQYAVLAFILLKTVISGYRMVAVAGDEDAVMENEKRFLQSMFFGLLLILGAEVLVAFISAPSIDPINPAGGSEGALAYGLSQLTGAINFILSFFGIIGVVMLIWASVYYVTSFGNEDQAKRAKKIILGTAIGLVITLSAYGILNFFLVS